MMFIMNGVHGGAKCVFCLHMGVVMVFCLHMRVVMVVGDVNVLCFCGTSVLGLVG